MDDSVPSKLLTDLSSAAEVLRSHDFINVYSHFDTDGLTAAAIIAKALARENKEYSITIFPTLGEKEMKVIEETKSECVLVTDLGASYISRFDAMDCDVIVLDHHTIGDQAKRICYANPHLYGINGSNAGCGASMALLFAVTLREANWDLSPLAIIGLVGDMQHARGLLGLNTYIFNEASKKGFVKSMPGSMIPVGDLSSELFMSTDPFILGVSGNADGTQKFLEEAKINGNKNFYDLTEEESNRLSSLITLKLLKQGVTRDKLEECAKPRFYLPSWGTDAATMSSVINACGRQDHAGEGIAAALGDRECLEKAKEYDRESRKEILAAICKIVNEGKVNELEHIQWFDSSESGFTGMICSIIMSYTGNPNKPTIGVNCSEEVAHVSSRASYPLLDKGVNLALAMKEACAKTGGEGGGHNIASGGTFDKSKRDEFLAEVDRIIGEQTAGKKA